jgi:hypothetical protein
MRYGVVEYLRQIVLVLTVVIAAAAAQTMIDAKP